MTDERNCKWTIDTLLVHLDSRINASVADLGARLQNAVEHIGARIDAAEKLNAERTAAQALSVAAALQSADRAVSKAETAAEKRFESVNEFRNTLSDQQRNLIPRAEFDAMEKSISFRLDAIDKQMAEQRAERMGIKGGWGYAAGVAGLIIAVISIAAALTQWSRT